MKIRTAKLGELTLLELPIESIQMKRPNYRKMSPEAFEALKESIKKFGFRSFILVKKDENGQYYIVDGHHRLEAMRQLGMNKIPAILLPDTLSPEEVDLARITFNIVADVEPEEYIDLLFDLAETYSPDELSKYLAVSQDELERILELKGFTEEDSVSEIPQRKRSWEYWRPRYQVIIPEGDIATLLQSVCERLNLDPSNPKHRLTAIAKALQLLLITLDEEINA